MTDLPKARAWSDTNSIPMTVDEALEMLETALAPERLNLLQEKVFQLCWAGKTYQEIAEKTGYDHDYIRRVGSQLWKILSELLTEKVTKSNVRAVLRQYARQSQETTLPEILPCPLPSSMPDFPSGSVPLNSAFYISRPLVEDRVYKAITRASSLIRIKAPKQWGKTSLMLRILAFAESKSYFTIRLSFHQADQSTLASLDQLLRWFCMNLTHQLQLEPRLDDYWDQDLGSKMSCTSYLRNYILEQLNSPIVIALDDLDRLFLYPKTAQDFLPLLRFWHEEVHNDESWAKLRLLVAHSTEAYIPLNLNQSPFNVGLPIRLKEFTVEQVKDLAQRHGCDWSNDQFERETLTPLRDLLGGHPYLLSLALYHLCHQEISLKHLLESAPTQAGIFSSYLRNHLVTLQQHSDLAQVFKQIVIADEPIAVQNILAYKLESLGLIDLFGDQATPRCELYRKYFRAYQDQL